MTPRQHFLLWPGALKKTKSVASKTFFLQIQRRHPELPKIPTYLPKTVAIRVGDGRTIHSLGGVDVTICLGDETVTQHCRVLDIDAFDIVIGTDFLRRNP